MLTAVLDDFEGTVDLRKYSVTIDDGYKDLINSAIGPT
jgi:hypothetical protein